MNDELIIQLLNKLADTYTKYDASIIEEYLAEDFHYASMWVFDEITSKEAYLNYLRGKLQTMKNNGVLHKFEIIQGSRGYGLLVTYPPSNDDGYGFVIQLNDNNKIARIDMTAACFL